MAAAQVAQFFSGGGASGWNYRRMILHYASLAKSAGGVDAFLIGSELRGLTALRDADNKFPFVAKLCSLAADVRAMLGPSAKITYGADWSEYFGHHPADGSDDVFFHLDDLWAHEAIDAVGIYDGVWANACLLHVPRTDLPAVIGRIHRALKPGGVFHASFKAGEAEGRDQFGRYYNYPSAGWLEQAYRPGPWESVAIEAAKGGGYDNKPTDWLFILARKAGH